ncbi:Type I restriction modification DNA specificity domain [Vibrio sp. B1ASS3]|uniref:restriction endonuclease subunit S n=1 Tax=Vibrio sp. B1ASS3 TaxID=2751176 RepID=UPI001ABA11F3|nr:restriction endonuclease subunit S [Vibrio sp. B1ASS3]CAD7818745.1 Type I restriction modification DNA specificity domain [Vibrio sp. B1ASS3]CAE6936082.1 Type I restriction modification DNA specificity domain [Vibrio sp. B1ASS3]
MIFDIEKYSKIPDGWSKVKLSELADFNANSWSKKDKPDTINYIDISSVSTGKVAEPTEMKFDSAPSRARRKVAKGDIIISTVRPNLKQFALLDFNNDNLTASTGFCTITPKKTEYTWLIYSVVTTDIFTEHLVRVAQGAAYPAIKPSDISEAYIGLPPQEELHKLNTLIGALWQKQTINEAMNQTLEKLAQRIFKSWFIDFDPVKANKEGLPFDGLSPEIQALFPSEFEDSELGMIPKGWEVSTIKQLQEKLSKGTTPRKKDVESAQDAPSIPFIKVRNISDTGSIESELETVASSIHEGALKRSILQSEDLLFTIAGTIGRVAIVPDTLNNSNCNQAVCFIRLKDKPTYNNYLYLHLKSKRIQEQISSKVVQAVQANASLQNINDINFPLPTNKLMESWNKVTLPLFDRIKEIEKQNITLTRLRDRLLPKLVSGQISVGEATQELAEAV